MGRMDAVWFSVLLISKLDNKLAWPISYEYIHHRITSNVCE